MTVIVAVSDGTRVCMACDSQATNNGTIATLASPIATLASPKIVKSYGRVLGWSGDLVGQDYVTRILPDLFANGPEAQIEHQAREAHWKLWEYLDSRKGLKVTDGASEVPGTIWLACRSEFVLVESTGAVLKLAGAWWAGGSGADIARGALHVASGHEHADAGDMARVAVAAAIALDNGCGPPVHVEWTDP